MEGNIWADEALKLAQVQVTFEALYGNRKDLTSKELTGELLRMTVKDNISYEGFCYLKKYLIREQ